MYYTEVDIAFLAGFFEGEGAMWLGYDGNGKEVRIRADVAVTNNDENLLNHFKSKFGGTIHRKSKMIGEYKHYTYQWHLASKDIGPILTLMLPFLITKKEVAELLIEYRATVIGPRRRPTKEGKQKRIELYEKYVELVDLRKNNIVKIKSDPLE